MQDYDPGEGLDLSDGAFSDLSDLALRDAKRKILRNAEKKLRDQKALKGFLHVVGWFLVILIAVIVFYGAASYLADLPDRIWKAIESRHVGEREDDYAAYYANEAKFILEGIRDGTLPIGNDMAMLSKEDLQSVMEFVIDYNDRMLFETSPERVRYFYEQTGQKATIRHHTYKEPDAVEWHVISDALVKLYNDGKASGLSDSFVKRLLSIGGAKKDEVEALFAGKTAFERTIPGKYVTVTETVYSWKKPEKKYSLETLSHQSFGTDFYNPYSGDNSFAVPWQVVVALLEMYVEGRYENLGSDEDGWRSAHYEQYALDGSYQTSMDGYYVTDAQIRAICELVSYRVEAYKLPYGLDYVQMTRYLVENRPDLIHYGGGVTRENRTSAVPNDLTWGLSFDEGEMKLLTYRRISDYQTGSEEDGSAIRFQEVRVPSLAPLSISNAYTMVSYEYKDVPLGSGSEEEGASYCSSMTVTTDSLRFTEQVRSLIPNFEWGHFLELLSMLPGSEKETEKYERIRALYERGEMARKRKEEGKSAISESEVRAAYRSTVTKTGGFYGFETYVGALSTDRTELGRSLWDSSRGLWIGTHLLPDGSPAKAPDGVLIAAYDDWFPLSDLSRASFSSSDELTRQEVGEVMGYLAENWTEGDGGLKKLLSSEKVADAVFDYQRFRLASVTGILALIRVRGGDEKAKYYERGELWNLFGLKGDDGELIDFCTDYQNLAKKKKLKEDEAFALSVAAQLSLFYEKYCEKGSVSYARLEFGEAFGHDAPTYGQEYYLLSEEYMKDAYLPWWEDKRFPFLAGCGEGIHLSGVGWCNAAGEYREELLGVIGKTLRSAWAWPVADYVRVSGEFGYRESPTAGASSYHQGMDIAAPGGSEITAIGNGIVTKKGYDPSRGYFVEIEHPDGTVRSIYMHMREATSLSEGDAVSKGKVIGYVGSTGISTGNHLHLGISENGIYVDPRNYVAEP